MENIDFEKMDEIMAINKAHRLTESISDCSEIINFEHEFENGIHYFSINKAHKDESVFSRYHIIAFRDVTDPMIYHSSNIVSVDYHHPIQKVKALYKANLTYILSLID